MEGIHNIFRTQKARFKLTIFVLSAVMLLIILIVQHLYMTRLLEDELEKKAETELAMKAILIKSMLNGYEAIVRDYEWDMLRNLNNPDSICNAAMWVVKNHKKLVGSGLCFEPYYYPQKGRLFEPYARRVGDQVIIQQLASDSHDYTHMDFYRKVIDRNEPYWSDPYNDTSGDGTKIITFATPIHDGSKTVGIFGLDIPLQWLSDTINARHMHPSSFNLLLTEKGELVVRPAEDHVESRDIEQVVRLINDTTVKRESSGRACAISFTSDDDGDQGCIYYIKMRGKPHWKIAVVCYDKEVYGKATGMTANLMLMLLITSAFLAIIIRYFMRSEYKLNRANLQQERLGSELRIASQIQQSMLPREEGIVSKRDDLDVYGTLKPAREVGGDLFEFIVRDEKLFFCIGDVSGKGVPAALVMAVVQAMFRAGTGHSSSPANIVYTINKAGCRNNWRNMFATLFVGVLDLPTGRLRYCNAGHDTPVIIQDEAKWLPVIPNLPVGVIDDFVFETQECQLAPGDVLFLYTDGLTEAMDENHHQYGQQRMLDCLNDSCHSSSDVHQMLDDIIADVTGFVGGYEQTDDLTMLAVRYTPRKLDYMIDEVISLANDVKQVPQLNAFVEDVAQRLNFDKTQVGQIKLAVEEAVVNVMQYAYPLGTTGDIQVKAQCDGESLKFVISDSGKAFDPTQTARADTSSSVEERPIGGLGILLVREMMDSINYERVNGKNLLTLWKRIDTNKKQKA